MQKKGRNLRYGRDFLAPTPSVRQPLFETSDLSEIDLDILRKIYELPHEAFDPCSTRDQCLKGEMSYISLHRSTYQENSHKTRTGQTVTQGGGGSCLLIFLL